jgi:NTE family protein
MDTTRRPDPAAAPATAGAPRAPGDRALVLGGGGSTGNAWLLGVVAGLLEAGVDVATADLTVGTSAGATAAAQLADARPTALFAAALAAAPPLAAALAGHRGLAAARSGVAAPQGAGHRGRGGHR